MPNKYVLREVTKYNFKLEKKHSLNILKSDVQANIHDSDNKLLVMNRFTSCTSLYPKYYGDIITQNRSGNMWAYPSTSDCSLSFNIKPSETNSKMFFWRHTI